MGTNSIMALLCFCGENACRCRTQCMHAMLHIKIIMCKSLTELVRHGKSKNGLERQFKTSLAIIFAILARKNTAGILTQLWLQDTKRTSFSFNDSISTQDKQQHTQTVVTERHILYTSKRRKVKLQSSKSCSSTPATLQPTCPEHAATYQPSTCMSFRVSAYGLYTTLANQHNPACVHE